MSSVIESDDEKTERINRYILHMWIEVAELMFGFLFLKSILNHLENPNPKVGLWSASELLYSLKLDCWQKSWKPKYLMDVELMKYIYLKTRARKHA